MGIFEPKDTCKLFKIDQTPGLMILPGLAYDFSGARLGYGGGYYDRYLEEIQHNVIRCGVAFECQWIEKVPCKPHDVLMDIIVTDEKWIERMDVR